MCTGYMNRIPPTHTLCCCFFFAFSVFTLSDRYFYCSYSFYVRVCVRFFSFISGSQWPFQCWDSICIIIIIAFIFDFSQYSTKRRKNETKNPCLKQRLLRFACWFAEYFFFFWFVSFSSFAHLMDLGGHVRFSDLFFLDSFVRFIFVFFFFLGQ